MRMAGILAMIAVMSAVAVWIWAGKPDTSRTAGPSEAACDLPEPQGPVLLEISVDPQLPGHDGQTRHIALDRAALETLPQDGFRTSTLWTKGTQAFRGVRLKALMSCLGIEEGTLTLRAANSYVIDIRVNDLRIDGALIAIQRNGAPMSLRDKGPLWLVYPFDSNPAFRTESMYAQSIWQLDRIEIAP